MAKQQELVTKHFEAHGAKVARQEFQARQRSRREPVAMVNLIASWHPERKRRVIFCSHYDTRPAAHEEPDRRSWSKPFVSANDGTSGVALFMELAHHLKDVPTVYGIDLVLFDGEEYIFDMGTPGLQDGDKYFFGSEHFAAEYVKDRGKLPYRYEAAILLDLFAAEDARLAVEGYSWEAAPQLVDSVWKTAAALGAKSFKTEKGFERGDSVLDDHVALIQAGIPAVDVIDFDYAHWHKLSDTPDKVSAKQLAEVGTVLTAWVQLQK
jgi:Zn-dependent M28 family amino/carboxypeptidase